MAMGYRHLHGYGVPQASEKLLGSRAPSARPQACTTAALNYIDVAKGIASIYSSGMPQAVELPALHF